ncbi:hypothetical protein [Serratia marcescens]|uniref:hypothetical protein n=1 Tax=Serratia marcescens TaxID=615 RepID=UPI0002B8A562|nr:hypothetical protein [Serratia marcescens]EMF07325.1 hypothetical protein F518_02787 [Serratia marcescens VGH107]
MSEVGKVCEALPADALLPDQRSTVAIVIVDGCSYGRMGLLNALRQASSGQVEAFAGVALREPQKIRAAEGKQSGNVDSLHPGWILVLRLPKNPREALLLLLQLEGHQLECVGYRRLVVLSPFHAGTIRRFLACCGVQFAVRIVNARHSVAQLSRAVLQEREDEWLPWMPALILSVRERDVMRRTLQGIPIVQQALCRRLSPKTLYAQRSCALMKLGVSSIPALHLRFGRMP